MIVHKNNENITDLAMLHKITKTINSNLDLNHMLESIYYILEMFLGIDDFCLYLWNKENKNFKLAFDVNRKITEGCLEELDIRELKGDQLLNEYFFFIQEGKEFIKVDKLIEKDLKVDTKKLKLFLPLIEKNNFLGIICFAHPKFLGESLTLDHSMIFSIISIQISTAIINDELRKQISFNAVISNAIKDIAKIIETQYELDYVIPLMGEIMDKYIPNALVYLFLKDKNNGFKLSWPSSYSKITIDPLLESVKNKLELVISDNKQILAMPLMYKGILYGAVVADAKVSELDDGEIELLDELTKQCAVTISRANAYAETVKYATVDALTGLDNRRQLDKRLLQEASVVIRTNRLLSTLMIDIDHFKQINDTHGHSVGDYVLKEVAKIIKMTIREYDIAGRYGGEEFVVLLPDTQIEGARKLAERLRIKVEKTLFNIGKYASSKTETIKITLSIGVALFDSTYKNPADIYEEADIALYKAKQEGRNRVVLFSGD